MVGAENRLLIFLYEKILHPTRLSSEGKKGIPRDARAEVYAIDEGLTEHLRESVPEVEKEPRPARSRARLLFTFSGSGSARKRALLRRRISVPSSPSPSGGKLGSGNDNVQPPRLHTVSPAAQLFPGDASRQLQDKQCYLHRPLWLWAIHGLNWRSRIHQRLHPPGGAPTSGYTAPQRAIRATVLPTRWSPGTSVHNSSRRTHYGCRVSTKPIK